MARFTHFPASLPAQIPVPGDTEEVTWYLQQWCVVAEKYRAVQRLTINVDTVILKPCTYMHLRMM